MKALCVRGLLALSLAGGLFFSMTTTATTAAAPQTKKQKLEEMRHPRIHAALHELREAKRELEEAKHDFGGHRVEAVKAIDHSIVQLELALRFAK